ncbi:hypothetical protein, partial [Actinomycetospora sp.]|uniref:hypothetical protein n=1 Tax=Actinomycetospora sp. TaxID=1872135 RepID=UPI002F8E6694
MTRTEVDTGDAVADDGPDDLLDELIALGRRSPRPRHDPRLLLEALEPVGSVRDLARVLEQVVNAAAEMTGARHAVLGVIEGGRLATLLDELDAETRARIGALPVGTGVLG